MIKTIKLSPPQALAVGVIIALVVWYALKPIRDFWNGLTYSRKI